MANSEDTIVVSVIGNGLGASAGVIQNIISEAHIANPSIASGVAVAKMTILSVGAEGFSVAIAVQSGDPDRIGRASTAAIASIVLSTVAAIAVGALGVTGIVPAIGIAIAGAAGTWLGKQIWEQYKESLSSGTIQPRDVILPDGISFFDDWSIPGGISNSIDTQCNTSYRTSAATRAPIRRDPLAIDLDGDGIETVGVTATPVLFDHNADGIKTGTGWVAGDDGWLALDIDGNGLIDSGRELFGADTVLSGTPGVDAVYATTGFQALKALDSNGDNLFDAADTAFGQVRIWQDANQDGVSRWQGHHHRLQHHWQH